MPKSKWGTRKKGSPKQKGQRFKIDARNSGIKGSGKSRKYKPVKSMFGETKHKFLSDIVKIDTPENARKSVGELMSMYHHGGDKVLIRQATNLASNRTGVISRNKRVSPEQREEAKQVQKIYRDTFNKMKAEG